MVAAGCVTLSKPLGLRAPAPSIEMRGPNSPAGLAAQAGVGGSVLPFPTFHEGLRSLPGSRHGVKSELGLEHS
jgi:hypothetical protein